ncbi:MAG TPA: glycosyltransferase [Lacipirellulaceae bacterium]|nr:glycosyltransferase [Lacipirellulaceae bacterium]
MTQPVRILHVISHLDGYGGARTLRWLAARQAARGEAIAVAALSSMPEIVAELQATGVEVCPLASRWRADPIAAVRLAQAGRRTAPRVVHAWDAPALLYARLAVRDRPLAAAWMERRRAWPWAAPHGIAPLPRGIATGAPSPLTRREALDAMGLSPEAEVIAMAGPLERRKGLDEAIWDFELLRVLHPRARLVLLGDGPDRCRLERYAHLVSEPGCVRFPGYRADVAALLPHADVFWQLDAAEATPLALLEAMSAGVPAVVSGLPALEAAVRHEETGLVVRRGHRAGVARATDQLLNDRALAQRLGAEAAAEVRGRWTLDAAEAACEAAYGEALGRR